MRRSLARTGGLLAVGLSALWTLPGAGFVVFGVLLLISGDQSDTEGFAEFFGGSMAGVGVLVLGGAVGGIIFGLRLRRGRKPARLGLGILFSLFLLVSGMFLASAIADDSGVDPGGVAAFGLNTAICLAVVLAALFGDAD